MTSGGAPSCSSGRFSRTQATTTVIDASGARGKAVLSARRSHDSAMSSDAQTVLSSPNGASDSASLAGQRAWALWLTGCVVVYGLLPRLLLALLSTAVWHARKSAMQPDFRDAYYLKLMARFDALQLPHVVDADGGRVRRVEPRPGQSGFRLIPHGDICL